MYIDQNWSTTMLQGEQKEEVTTSNKRATYLPVQEGHDAPTGDDGTMSLEYRGQDGMSTNGGDDQSHTGSVGQAQAQVHRIPRPSSPHHLVSQLS